LKEAFLSYAHEDKILGGKVKQILEANGVSAFLAHEDLEVSAEWRMEILRHLDTSSALIAVVTDNFAKSMWANQEVGIAIAKKLTLIPLMFGGSRSMKGFIEMYQGVTVSEENLDTAVKGLVPRINEGVSSAERTALKDLKNVLGRLLARWQTYNGLPSNEKWSEPAVKNIQDTFGKESEKLLSIISEGTDIDFGVKSSTQTIIIQIQRFVLYKIDFQANRGAPFAEMLPDFHELENRGNQVIETARALHGWFAQTQKAL
jgi:hypothetical protein